MGTAWGFIKFCLPRRDIRVTQPNAARTLKTAYKRRSMTTEGRRDEKWRRWRYESKKSDVWANEWAKTKCPVENKSSADARCVCHKGKLHVLLSMLHV